MRDRILLVEPKQQINQANQRILENHGYQVFTARSGKQARLTLKREKIDLLILGVLLPDVSGLDFCQEVRQTSLMPILFLSDLAENEDIIAGLEMGGDAYLGKPYDKKVLLAKVSALLRRQKLSKAASLQQIGPYQINYHSLQVFKDGTDLLLVPKEFAIFTILVENINHFVSAEELYQDIWGQEAHGDIRTIYPHISRLRSKLQLAENMQLTQRRGYGYKLEI